MAERRLRSALTTTRRGVLAGLAAGAAAPKALAQSSRSLTFRSDSDVMRFPGTVNGAPVVIMLDSGAANTVLDRRFAEKAGVTSSGEEHTARGLSGSQVVQRSNPVQLSFAGISLNGPAALADLSAFDQTGETLSVILGRPIFDAFGVEIDFAAHRLTVHQRGSFHPTDARRTDLVLTESGLRKVQIGIEGKEAVWADLDLGSNSALSLDATYARSAGLLSGRPKSTWISAGIGGLTSHEVATARMVSVAGVEVADCPIEAVPDWSLENQIPANIGFPLIRQLGRIFIDYAENALYVFPGAQKAEPFVRNRLGLALSPREGGGWRVMHVAAGSPGDLAKWKVGEEINAINGDKAMDRTARTALANGAPGTAVAMTMANGEARTLVLKDYY